MTWSFPIGRLFGSQLRVHVTFLLLLAWIAWAGWQEGGPTGAAANTAFVLLLFACVIAHEFGHALTARRFGIRTPDVTLLPIGGVARLERMPEDPRQEILVALAGPMVNVVIFLALWALGATRNMPALDDAQGLTFATLPGQLAVINLWLALFNLLPAFPMDGGRVLRALLALKMDRVTATRRAAQLGQVLAFGLGLLGFASGNIILLFIGLFIMMAAGAESNEVETRQTMRGLRVRDAMITEYEALAPGDSLDTASSALIRTTQHEFPVLDPASGRYQGLLTRQKLFAALAAEPRPQSVAEIMERDLPVLRLNDPLDKVLEALQHGAPAVIVQGQGGGLLGYVTRENLGELMVVAHARKARAGG